MQAGDRKTKNERDKTTTVDGARILGDTPKHDGADNPKPVEQKPGEVAHYIGRGGNTGVVVNGRPAALPPE